MDKSYQEVLLLNSLRECIGLLEDLQDRLRNQGHKSMHYEKILVGQVRNNILGYLFIKEWPDARF